MTQITNTELSRLGKAINDTDLEWTVCFIGEDQSEKLADLTFALKRAYSETGDGKEFASGFSYWGVGPTIAWREACNDPFYLVMKESTTTFKESWEQVGRTARERCRHYVSLGVGDGKKDGLILESLLKDGSEPYFFPIDMSPEMLRVGLRGVRDRVQLPGIKALPVQLDFEMARNVSSLRRLLDTMVDDEPILFSLLGNTVANFEKDADLLRTLAGLLRPQDFLLLEVASTDALDADIAQKAAEEYGRINRFRQFVTSALLQNTDLHIDGRNLRFKGGVERDEGGERAIRVKIFYKNASEQAEWITLPDREKVEFRPGDTIRLYLTRKYISEGVDRLTSGCGLHTWAADKRVFSRSGPPHNFGIEMRLLAATQVPQELVPKQKETSDVMRGIWAQ